MKSYGKSILEEKRVLSEYEKKVKVYELKLEELHALVEAEAKAFQDVVTQKETATNDVQTLQEHKTLLQETITKMQKNCVEAVAELGHTMSRERSFVESAKREVDKEKESLTETKNAVVQLKEEHEQLIPRVEEIREYSQKLSAVREEYTAESIKLEKIKHECTEIASEVERGKDEIKKKQKTFEGMRAHLEHLHNKAFAQMRAARETVDFVNKRLQETGTPMKFNITEVVEVNLETI